MHVAPAAAEIDELGAVGNAVEYRSFRIELFAKLIEVGELDVRSETDGPGVGCKLAEQQTKQRGFSGTVRTDEPDAIAAHDRRAEVANDRAIAVREAHIPRFDDELSGTLCLLCLQLDRAGSLPTLASFDAQGLQRANASFVSRATRLNAGANPHLFARQLLVELRPLLRLRGQRDLFPCEIGVVIRSPIHEASAVELDDAGRQTPKKGTVVRDEQQC